MTTSFYGDLFDDDDDDDLHSNRIAISHGLDHAQAVHNFQCQSYIK
jgi:hypothetical protein